MKLSPQFLKADEYLWVFVRKWMCTCLPVYKSLVKCMYFP